MIFVGNQIQYNKHEGKFCGKGNKCNKGEEPRYGNFSTFEEALAACDSDSNCEMVMDHFCDASGPFELCSSSSLCRSGQGTCSYQKPSGYLKIFNYMENINISNNLSTPLNIIVILQNPLSLVVLKTLQNVGVLALGATLADMVTMRSVIPMNAMIGQNVLAMVTGAKMQVINF